MKAVFKRFSGRIGMLGPVLFWGTLWGIWEATAGHILHLTHVPGLPGLVMIPVAFFFMSKAFVGSGRYESVVLTACVAAGIKMFDMFIPGQSLQAVVNPAQAILLESLVVTGIYVFLGSLGAGDLVLGDGRKKPRG